MSPPPARRPVASLAVARIGYRLTMFPLRLTEGLLVSVLLDATNRFVWHSSAS